MSANVANKPTEKLLMKVQFWGTSTVTAVETQGGPSGLAYTTQYCLMFSSDCVTFQPILDDLGNIKVILYRCNRASAFVFTLYIIIYMFIYIIIYI